VSGWLDCALFAAAGIPTVVYGPHHHGVFAHTSFRDSDWRHKMDSMQEFPFRLDNSRAHCTSLVQSSAWSVREHLTQSASLDCSRATSRTLHINIREFVLLEICQRAQYEAPPFR
jgi:hypothetical protein